MTGVLLIDDEPLAHKVLLHHLQQHDDMRVLGQCYSATEALAWLASNQADLLFVDINMPVLNGIDMLKVLANRPQVVIVSAYQEYAIDGFELDVCDYLLKPVSPERLAIALDKVRLRQAAQQMPAAAAIEPDSIVVKVDRQRRKVLLVDIDYCEAYGNYVRLWQGQQSILISSTLKQLLAELPSSQFSQIHKSFVVRHSAVTAMDHDSVSLHNNITLKIGKSFKGQLTNLLHR